MTTKYYAILTNTGAALLANATALGRQLPITQMALGDGGGTLPTPDTAQTKLLGERRRAPLNSLSVDPANTNQIIAEQVIPEDEGGWWIREIGLYDADGNLIAVANCPETYKPQLQEGSGRVQTVRMILIVSSTDAVTLKIDPAVVLATRAYTDGKAAEAKTYADNQAGGAKDEARRYADAQMGSAKIEVKAYADDKMAAHLAAINPHPQYAPLASPALTGVPTAPTASFGATSAQIANMIALHAAKFSLSGVSSVTGSNVLTAAAAGSMVYMTGSATFTTMLPRGDAVALGQMIMLVNYSTTSQTITTSVANIIYGGPIAGSLASVSLPPGASLLIISRGNGEWDICGGSGSTQYASGLNFVSPALSGTPTAPTAVQGTNTSQIATTAFAAAGLSQKLDINEIVGIPLPWPQATAPVGWLKCNGQAFDKAVYTRLAQVYPSGVLPDLRGEFIRGWDDGRGVDSGRAIISKQNATALRTGAMDYNGSDADSAGVYVGIGYADADSSVHTITFTNQGYPNGVLMSDGVGKDNGVSGTASNTVFSGGVNWITMRPRSVAFNYIVRAA
ncbi:phage tail-collar fiber domain-containing protein [Dickeya dianthicola]|uniref:phage tail-collar fiber domain-containing protein n=1 Tax=Dickeya dianthicola TaxID=204039 RepID=UPI001867CD38|nr:phage tail protein [Dickeya dianthicola]QOL13297.1 phage tail protein [Dickeya dianthicola]